MDEFDGGFLHSSAKHEYTGIHTLRNLCLKQISTIPTDESSSVHLVDRFEVSTVTVCGTVVSFKKISTGCIFEIDDTTATLECVMWVNDAIEEVQAEQIKEGALLRLTGSIKVFGGKRSLNVASVNVVDVTVFVYHLTNCLYQHLHFTNKLAKGEQKRPSIGFTRIQSDILDVYRNNQDEDGLGIEVVVAMLQDKYNERDIKNAVEGLLNGCHLYSVDGNSYRTTI